MSDYGNPPQDPNEWQQPDASQQQPFANPQAQPDVPDYLIWSILETLFCCLPFGIAGIVFSAQANSKKGNQDFAGAQRDAAQAKKMLKIGAIVGAIGIVLYVAFLIIVGVAGSNADTSSGSF